MRWRWPWPLLSRWWCCRRRRRAVRIILRSPNPDFIAGLASPPLGDANPPGLAVSPRAIAQVEAHPKSTLLDRHTFGAGPYVLLPSQTVTGDHCTFVPNKYYYDR